MEAVSQFHYDLLEGRWIVTYNDGSTIETNTLPIEFEEIGESAEIIQLGFDYRWDFKYGLCPVKIDGKWGFVDSLFNIAIPPLFDMVGEENIYKSACWRPEEYAHTVKWVNGVCKIRINGKESAINEKGDILSKYESTIRLTDDISFDEIIRIAKDNIPSEYSGCPWKYPGLNHGTAVLTTEEQCCAYIAAYGSMHQSKINEVLDNIKVDDFRNNDIQIIDWGCGQGLATVCLFDFFNKKNIPLELVKRVMLIEPSEMALQRAILHVSAYIGYDHAKIASIKKFLDDVNSDEIKSEHPITIHLFSNILDIPSIDLLRLSNVIKNNLNGQHYFFCWGPLNYGNSRIDIFWNYFNEADSIFSNVHSKQQYDNDGRLIKTYNYTAKNRVFKVNGDECELILVDYYLPKQFHAAYQLDAIRKALSGIEKEKLEGLYRNLSEFEIQTPFDIGASIYDDVHPILAVLSNLVTRGLPTKASPFLEDCFTEFGNKQLENALGAINYNINGLKKEDLFLAMHLVDPRWNITPQNYNISVLDSDLEKSYITEVTSPLLRQLLQPQRSISSISGSITDHSGRVDFAFEFPYSSKGNDNTDYYGCVIELDGKKYHSPLNQQLLDIQRNQALHEAHWYCIRLSEDDISKSFKEYHNLESDYVSECVKAYDKKFDSQWIKTLQLVLTPIAVARLEKTILEALMTGQLSINSPSWKVLVREHDVPCAAIAFEEMRQMFEHITQLSEGYAELRFPVVDLTIVSTKEFSDSPLHLNHYVYTDDYHSNIEYDMVIDNAILRRNGLEKIDFTNYRCKNKCYFNVRSAHYHRNERQIYTSDRIVYKPIAIANAQGRYDNIEQNVSHLRYFLQFLFRKQDFRQGQTPILSRALQYKSVIGLLPTGGGKSLTYQIAAMLQPGITLIIDPLRSLMKDQFDGLISAGIDCCSYINSSIEVPEKIREQGDCAIKKYRIEERERRSKRLEKSELMFMFLSPERLSIMDFRERLRNMRDTGVYFAYGVIDEVHCVSEWGHDFRFSYLHLGRNLYKYVLPKQDEEDEQDNHIPLFGLTATASFDVLADVERELSGNGAFPLDAETIVREGDTNRLEMQFKVESVPVTFTEKEKNGSIKQDKCKWTIYDAKNAQLDNLISLMPHYLNELLEDTSVQTIVNGYTNGPRADGREINPLDVSVPDDFLTSEETYEYGGIVFCPHKDNTGVAVFTNKSTIAKKHPKTLIGTFVGSSDDEDNDEGHNREEESFANLELFRENKAPLMIATKAFGMGIDKPNVRYTINLNYSSSLESFVQEAGRAGRDRRMALSVIMLSKYHIARVKTESQYYGKYKNRWYDANEIEELSTQKGIPIEDFETCDETSDLVKLTCKQCGNSCERFEKNCCTYSCSKQHCSHRVSSCNMGCEFAHKCDMANIPSEDRWSRYDHLKVYKEKYPFISNVNYEFLNADYETVLFFYNNNFKGEFLEYQNMCNLLSQRKMEVAVDGKSEITNTISGFLATLQTVSIGAKVISYISYTKSEYADIAKAIYRMCCVGIIEDYTQDYNRNQFRIVSRKKAKGSYYKELESYLKRYYTEERAKEEIEKEVKGNDDEIHNCLKYLTHFIYDKIAVKRKRALDDMFSFCVHGVDESRDWKAINEDLKDDLFFYFNSKYARRGYVTESNKNYSLIDETDEGKISSPEILFKYMKVVDNEWIAKNSEAGSTQIDNAKHLYGAVRLIRRSLTDQNPAIDLLGCFCLMFLGTNNNRVLQDELEEFYVSGMLEFFKRSNRQNFWKEIFDKFNNDPNVSNFFRDNGGLLKSLAALEIHKLELSKIKNKYIQ